MKKVTIMARFQSKDLKEIFTIGEIKEFEDARAESLVQRGLVKLVDDADPKAEEDADVPFAQTKVKKNGKSSKTKDATLQSDVIESETDPTSPDKDKQ